MTTGRPLNIPVILGTTRKGRLSAHAARFMTQRNQQRANVTTELIDITAVPMPIDDAGDGIKDPAFAEKMTMADALVIVTPEYNHSFPGLLKHVLDSCLKEYIHKAAGIVGVSAGPFGGVRAIQDFLPVIRELAWSIFFGTSISLTSPVYLTNRASCSTRPLSSAPTNSWTSSFEWRKRCATAGITTR